MRSKVSDLAEQNRQRLFAEFDKAEKLLAEGFTEQAAKAFKDCAVSYRRHAGALHSAALEDWRQNTRLSLELNLKREWIDKCSSGPRMTPLDFPWVDKRVIEKCLIEIGLDSDTRRLIEYHRTGELMTWKNRLRYKMLVVFGLENCQPFKMTTVDDLLASEIIERAKKYDIVQNPPPPFRYTSSIMLKYYNLHAQIENLYFTACENIGNQNEKLKLKAIEIAQKLKYLEVGLGTNSECAFVLRFSLKSSLEVLDVTESTDDLLAQVERELSVCGYQNQEEWYFEPDYWNDQIGNQLNALLTTIWTDEGLNDHGYIQITNEIYRAANEGKLVLRKWVHALRGITSTEEFEMIRTVSRSYRRLFNEACLFVEKVSQEDIDMWTFTSDLNSFAERRNAVCLELSKAWTDS